jgi:hypothetical protein
MKVNTGERRKQINWRQCWPPQQTRIMKNINKILMVAAIAVAGASANSAKADDSLLSPRAKGNQPLIVSIASRANGANLAMNRPDGNAKAWEQAQSLKAVPSTSSTAVASVGYRATGDDGITASPKQRQQLNDHGMQFTVAPLK